MMYGSAQAFRRALEARLDNLSRETGLSIVRLRKLVTYDRLLAHLLAISPDAWRLKGALALEYRLGSRSRATMDVDLERKDYDDLLAEDLIAAQEVYLDDGFNFRLEREEGDPDDVAGSVRFRVEAELAGRVFEWVSLDIGPASALACEDREEEVFTGPDLLGFAGIPPVRIRVISLEQHLAETVHAYTRTYSGGQRSSRPKDLVDMLLIQSAAPVSAGRLRHALHEIFAERQTHPLCHRLPEPPEAWKMPFRRLAEEVGFEADLSAAHGAAAALFDPVVQGLETGLWSPLDGEWTAGEQESAG